MKYIRGSIYKAGIFKDVIERMARYRDSLPVTKRDRRVVIAIVFDGTSPARRQDIMDKLRRETSYAPFSATTRVFDFEDLTRSTIGAPDPALT